MSRIAPRNPPAPAITRYLARIVSGKSTFRAVPIRIGNVRARNALETRCHLGPNSMMSENTARIAHTTCKRYPIAATTVRVVDATTSDIMIPPVGSVSGRSSSRIL